MATAASIPLRTLVVDDNRDATQMLGMLLEASRHEVSVAHSSVSALNLTKAELPDVCLLKIGLPDMDGYELARCLRSEPETAKSILIAVTGIGQAQDRDKALAAGFDHHLVKPVEGAKLMHILNDVQRSQSYS